MRSRSTGRLALCSMLLVGASYGCTFGPTAPDPQPHPQLPEGRYDPLVGLAATMTCDGVTRTLNDLLSIGLDASAVEFDASNSVWKGGSRVRLRLDGTFEPVVGPGEFVAVTGIVLFGESGTAVETGGPCDVLLTLPRPRPRWQVPALDADWDGVSTYKLIVRHLYDLTSNGHVTHHYQDRIGSFALQKSNHMDTSGMVVTNETGSVPAHPGDTISTAYASGSFLSTQGLAMYDVRVEYQGLATSFEVWTRPDTNPAASWELIHTAVGPPPGTWSESGIAGAYDSTYPNWQIAIKLIYRGSLISTATGNFINAATNGNAQFVTMSPH